MKGSWAGAMGQCQFIPTSFLAYAADGDGDGRMDIWTNKADVFASIANYLQRVGWRPGLEWGERGAGRHAGAKGERIVRPAGANGPSYRTTENFRAILRWNQSDFFGLAVGLLSDRIAPPDKCMTRRGAGCAASHDRRARCPDRRGCFPPWQARSRQPRGPRRA